MWIPATTDDGRVYYYHRVSLPPLSLCFPSPAPLPLPLPSFPFPLLPFLPYLSVPFPVPLPLPPHSSPCVMLSVYACVQETRAVRWTKPDAGMSAVLEQRRLQHEKETAERQAERVAARTAAEDERKQQAEAASTIASAVSGAIEVWYTAAGWAGNTVGATRRTARPPPPIKRVLADLLTTLHTIPGLTDLEPIVLPDDGPNEVKKAYLRCARAIHPDKLVSAPLEVRSPSPSC